MCEKIANTFVFQNSVELANLLFKMSFKKGSNQRPLGTLGNVLTTALYHNIFLMEKSIKTGLD